MSSYNITVTQPSNGAIVPAGVVSVGSGSASAVFAITPDWGYHIDSLTVDSAPVTAAPTYQFLAVAAAHTLSAVMVRDHCAVWFSRTLADASAVIAAKVTAGWVFVPPTIYGPNLPDADFGHILVFTYTPS